MFPSAPNFRDLGGLRTEDGRKVRHGVLYRSEAPSVFDPEDLNRLGTLGIRLVCDLRNPAEIAEDDPVVEGTRRITIPVLPEVRTGGPDLIRELISDHTGGLARANMIRSYSTMPAVFEPYFAGLITEILDGNLPMLVHCTGGKDRSGFVVALLLAAVGVEFDAIVADYELSRKAMDRNAIRRLLVGPTGRSGLAENTEISDEVLDAMTVDRAYLKAVFEAAADRHGSLEQYIEVAGQLDADRRSRLRDALLE